MQQWDIRFEAYNVLDRRARYRLPDGKIITAPRPEHLQGQFGPTLRGFVMHQYFHNQVTEPLLQQQLADIGVSISSGQISQLLTQGQDIFHQEKEALLPAAREISSDFPTDDTSARHEGRNGHTLHIGNDLFAYFVTTESKSRVNFLEILRAPYTDYVLGGDALFYLEWCGLPQRMRSRIASILGDSTHTWDGKSAWERQLQE